LAELAEQRRAS